MIAIHNMKLLVLVCFICGHLSANKSHIAEASKDLSTVSHLDSLVQSCYTSKYEES